MYMHAHGKSGKLRTIWWIVIFRNWVWFNIGKKRENKCIPQVDLRIRDNLVEFADYLSIVDFNPFDVTGILMKYELDQQMNNSSYINEDLAVIDKL